VRRRGRAPGAGCRPVVKFEQLLRPFGQLSRARGRRRALRGAGGSPPRPRGAPARRGPARGRTLGAALGAMAVCGGRRAGPGGAGHERVGRWVLRRKRLSGRRGRGRVSGAPAGTGLGHSPLTGRPLVPPCRPWGRPPGSPKGPGLRAGGLGRGAAASCSRFRGSSWAAGGARGAARAARGPRRRAVSGAENTAPWGGAGARRAGSDIYSPAPLRGMGVGGLARRVVVRARPRAGARATPRAAARVARGGAARRPAARARAPPNRARPLQQARKGFVTSVRGR
jgi:hypothetical protein